MATTQQLNGLDLEALEHSLALMREKPDKVREHRWTGRVRWLGGFKARVTTRNHQFVVDEPASVAAEDEAPTAVEYVLGALGACLATGFVLNASLRGVEIWNLEVSLDGGTDNPLTFFGIEQQGHPGYSEITAKLYVQADADRDTLNEIWEQTVRTSPVANTLSRQVKVVPELVVM